MSIGKSYVILAPHVDDEVIGCWRLLKSGQVKAVIYYYDLSSTRFAEARECANLFEFELHGVGEDVQQYRDKILVVPNIADHHPHHKQVNLDAQTFANTKCYYSVSMNVKMDVLEPWEQEEKRETLYRLFPSQRKYFDDHAECYLFESLLGTDWIMYQVEDNAGQVSTIHIRPIM